MSAREPRWGSGQPKAGISGGDTTRRHYDEESDHLSLGLPVTPPAGRLSLSAAMPDSEAPAVWPSPPLSPPPRGPARYLESLTRTQKEGGASLSHARSLLPALLESHALLVLVLVPVALRAPVPVPLHALPVTPPVPTAVAAPVAVAVAVAVAVVVAGEWGRGRGWMEMRQCRALTFAEVKCMGGGHWRPSTCSRAVRGMTGPCNSDAGTRMTWGRITRRDGVRLRNELPAT